MNRSGALVALGLFIGLVGPTSAQQRPHNRSATPFVPHGVLMANEGVWLNLTGPDPIIIDGLFREGVSGYRTVDRDLLGRLEGRVPRTQHLILATHHHADHFDPASVLAHLRSNPESEFVSTPNAVALIREMDPGADILARVHASYPEEGEREAFEFGRHFRLQTLNLHHGRSRSEIQNLGHLVDVGGFRLLHMGDTEVTVEEILEQGIAADDLHFAFVPYWLLLGDDGPSVIEAIGADRVFAIHLPLADVDASWWGGLGSLAGTIEALERLDRVTVLSEPGTRFDLAMDDTSHF